MLSTLDKVHGCVSAYERGTIILEEAILRVIATLAETEAPLEIVNSLTQVWQQHIWNDIDTAPIEGDEWDRIEVLSVGTYVGGSSDLMTQRKLTLIASYRAGVEKLRDARH